MSERFHRWLVNGCKHNHAFCHSESSDCRHHLAGRRTVKLGMDILSSQKGISRGRIKEGRTPDVTSSRRRIRLERKTSLMSRRWDAKLTHGYVTIAQAAVTRRFWPTKNETQVGGFSFNKPRVMPHTNRLKSPSKLASQFAGLHKTATPRPRERD